MNDYYLIARSRADNSFLVLELKESWYLGRSKANLDRVTGNNRLEAIDLVTTRFSSEKAMADRMKQHGYISDSNVDIFIANKKRKNGKDYIRFLEGIYNRGKPNFIDDIRKIAYSSLITGSVQKTYALDKIYNEAISLAFCADDYLQMVVDGDTNVPKEFISMLTTIGKYGDEIDIEERKPFNIGYDGIRNIVESINRLESFRCTSYEDRILLNDEFIGANLSGRMALIPELLFQLKNYSDTQLSIFSLLDSDIQDKVVIASTLVQDEEKSSKIKINRSLSNEEKRKEIFRVLRNIPRNLFDKRQDGKQYKVNFNLFINYFPNEDEIKKLSTYLTGNLAMYFACYVSDYKFLCDVNKDGFSPPSEIAELQREVEYDAMKINNRLKSTKCLNMAYEWCMLIEGVIKREKNAGVSKGDNKGKVYEKK